MTSIWGPLGWMTLHSVSTSYPENPTPAEKQLVSSWLDLFRDSITCHHCKDHFGSTLQNYRARFPNFLNSRQDFAMFAFRVHNAVNARLHKPVYQTLAECMEILRNNIKNRSAANYRISYLNHIARYWGSVQDISGIVAMKKVVEMRKIEMEYFSTHDTQFNVELRDDNVVIPRNWVEKDSGTRPLAPPVRAPPMNANARGGIRVVGGRIRLL